MSDIAPKDFFISYTALDEPWAERIAWQLEAAGYTTHLEAWDFVAGTNRVLEMNRGPRAQRTVIVLSPRFLEAEYPPPEWAAAFTKDPTGAQRLDEPLSTPRFDEADAVNEASSRILREGSFGAGFHKPL